MIKEVDLASLEAKAKAVVSQSERLQSAIDDARAQRVALIQKVLAILTPATLRAVASPIRIGRIEPWEGRPSSEYWSSKGLRLDGGDEHPGPYVPEGGSLEDLEGYDIYLLADGSVLELLYERVGDHEPQSWRSVSTLHPPEAVPLYLVTGKHDGYAIRALSSALDEQLKGKGPKRIEQVEREANQLRAIVTLMP